MKSSYVKNLAEGSVLDAPFYVKINTTTKQADGNYRLNGELVDSTGVIPFVRFDVEEHIVQKLGIGRIVGVRGRVVKSRYAPREARVSEFFPIKDEDIYASDYEVVSPIPLADMKAELEEMIVSVKDPTCRQLLDFAFPICENYKSVSILDIPEQVIELYEAFLNAPGATGHHHAYKHGLLQHTLDVTRHARALALASPVPLNIDVITTACLLHDIGKILTYSTLPNFAGYGVTQRGALLGHIILGLILTNNYIGAVGQQVPMDQNVSDHILHCIASHHTKKEYGSPVEPMTLEAMCVARADGHDAESFKVRAILENYTPGRESIKLGDRYYYAKSLEAEQLCVDEEGQGNVR